MSGTQLLPTRAVYRPDQAVAIEVRGSTQAGRLVLRHLGGTVAEFEVDSDGVVDLGLLRPGGYGVGLGDARTAVEVSADARRTLRYGFVVDYSPERDLEPLRDNLRRLHLTGVQFYDWAYRHADLMGGGQQYADALGQPVSLPTVRALVNACHDVGADALGYAAVYAAGPQEWAAWEHDALLAPSGKPYALGDFLFLVDPAATDWLQHFTGDLAKAVAELGFDGFHLDQYGYPKQAMRPDRKIVDVASSFRTLIGAVRETAPDARLVFNNVNDFPTWATAHTDQDAVYVEVWPPHVGLEHLAEVATRARAVGARKPVVVAAYQHVYDNAPASSADLATQFTMASLFSHGATQLLAGEADRILVDPYYVRNHRVAESTATMLQDWYDFAVEAGEVLFDPGIVDITGSVVGEYNDDVDVRYADGVVVDHVARPGTVWRRVTQLPDGRQVLHLINLCGQDDTLWDAPRNVPHDSGPATLRVRRTGVALPRVLLCAPQHPHQFEPVEMHADGDHAVGRLPAAEVWQVVLVDTTPATEETPL